MSETGTGKRGEAPRLMTRQRWIEMIRAAIVAIITTLYWQQLVPRQALLAGIAIGLYPLAKAALTEPRSERASVLAGTIVETGAVDVRTELHLGPDVRVFLNSVKL